MAEPMSVLSTEQCWDFLREQEVGRLAFHLADEVHITPINYGVAHETILFRTAPGSKLLGLVMNADVTFEIDEFTETEARSVIVRGRARLLEEDEAHRSDNLRLRPWVPTSKYNVVEIVPEEISGRHFDLVRPWLHLTPPN